MLPKSGALIKGLPSPGGPVGDETTIRSAIQQAARNEDEATADRTEDIFIDSEKEIQRESK